MMYAQRSLLALAMAALVLGPLCIGLPARGAQDDLPDISITPEDVGFSSFGTPLLNNSSARGQWVVIYATIRNNGPGNATLGTVDVSFFDGSELIETVNVTSPLGSSGNGSFATVWTLWNTTPAGIGPHTIRVDVNCSAGDANLTNNSASRLFTILPMPAALTFALLPSVALAAVTASAPAHVRFNGTAIADMGDLDAVSVNLSAVVDLGWELELLPASLTFSAIAGAPRPFTVTVTVPAAASVGAVGTLKVQGTAGPEELEGPAEATAKITVGPYFGVELSTAAGNKTVPPGASTSFTVTVHNVGNAVDSYLLEVDNMDELQRRGWAVTLSRSAVVRLGPGATEQVTVTAIAQPGMAPYTDETTKILIKAVSQDAPGNGSAQHILTLALQQRGYNTPMVIGYSLIGGVLVALVLALMVSRRRRPAAGSAAKAEEGPPLKGGGLLSEKGPSPKTGGPLMEEQEEKRP